jgi:nitroreductase
MSARQALIVALMVLVAASPVVAANKTIPLPPPRAEGGKPLLQALWLRSSTRQFSSRPIPRTVLGELLWAAFGINRPKEGKRTAPSAHNRQEVDIYVTTAEGAYLYDAKGHALRPVVGRDLRALTGRQKFPATAALNLVYVVDLARMPGVPRAAAIEAAAVSVGAIAENVYLYCASEGLGTVLRGWIDRPELARALGLKADQYILFAQTVGYRAGK